jgi:hypothetical protein
MTAAGTGVTANGLKFDNKTNGTGTSNMIYSGTGYDNILNYNGTPVINGTGNLVAGQLTGSVALTNGGTNASLTATQGGVVYSSASALAISAAGTSGQLLVSGGTGAPAYANFDLALHAPDSSYKKICRVATVGTNITVATAAPNTLDGITLLLNDRILVKDQTTPAQNGIYYVSTLGTGANGVWTRSLDADVTTDIDGATVAVNEGTLNGGRRFQTYWKATDVLGTTAMYWNRLVDVNASAVAPLQTTAVGLDIGTPTTSVTLATGAVTDLAINSFGSRTILSVAASTYARASTVYIAGAPVASTNATITAPYALYVAAGNTALGGTLATTATGTTTVNTGQIYLNGATSNRIDFNTNGTGIPTVTNISAGTKIVLKSAISGTLVDYAIGTDSATGGGYWESVPSTSFNFKWYAGVTQVGALAGLNTGGNMFLTQQVPATATATATLTITQLLTGAIQATPAATATYTLPTGTLIDTTIGTYVAIGMGFEWTIINLAAFVITVSAGATNTIPVAIGTIAAGSLNAPVKAKFRTIKTAANTYTNYRIG